MCMRDDAVCGLVWAMLGLLETRLRGLVGLFGDWWRLHGRASGGYNMRTRGSFMEHGHEAQ